MKNDKTQYDDDFEKLLQDFIDDALDYDDEDDLDTTDTLDEPDEAEPGLPFPRPVDDRVADVLMKSDHEKQQWIDDVTSIDVEVMPGCEKGVYGEGPVAVTLRARSGAELRNHRFTCYVYTDTYYPMCASDAGCEEKHTKRKASYEIPSLNIWLPGRYILFVVGPGESLVRVDFALDDLLNVKAGKPVACRSYGIEHTLTSCMQTIETEWDMVARQPGMAQFRQKMMQERLLLLYNEFRKELGEEAFQPEGNLIINTRNNDVSTGILKLFQQNILSDYTLNCIDCATLFDVSRTNPYELLPEEIEDCDMKILCLTHLSELTGASGKVIMRKVIDKVRCSYGKTFLWLCGSRQETDQLMELFPSLRRLFNAKSVIEQEPYTAFDLVQVFYRELLVSNLAPSAATKDRLARTIIRGWEQGALAGWSRDDIRRFIAEEVRPRFLQRAIPFMADDETTMLQQEDIPFDKLTSKGSPFEESIRELREMIGLDNVKQGIQSMANQTRLFQERSRRGLRNSEEQVYHCVFTGNPGTGKTTVAGKLGRIYHSLGLLSKGEVIAVDRTRLVGQYIGQTEENMKAVLEEAKGNVLFIDEAYNLSVGSDDKKDFGARVLDSLLTVLTQPNPDMLIVFAGYTQEMDAMLNSNPGLSSRFPYRYQFDDYTAAQLMEIAMRLFERDDYTLSPEASKEMRNAIDQALKTKDQHFGNARWIEQFVRNGIIPAMADRVISAMNACGDASVMNADGAAPAMNTDGDLFASSVDFQRIEASDVTKAFERFRPQAAPLKPHHKVVSGFSA